MSKPRQDSLVQETRKESVHEDVVNAFQEGKLKDVKEDQLQYIENFVAQDQEWRDQYTKKLLRKVDFRLIPMLALIYLLNFLDRSNLAQARLGGLEDDLGMTGTDFNLAISIFFVGYLIMQLPSNLLITRLRPSWYLGGVITLWGVVSTCNSAVHSFGSLIAVRICLGLAEAPYFPGAIFLLSSWYTRAELAYRIAWFYSGNALANMFGGLLAAGVLSGLDDAQGIAGWRWLFIIEGVITIAVGMAATMILPDFPATTKWLSDEERAFAQWRLVDDAKESDDTKLIGLWAGLKLALRDYRLYLFILLQHASILAQTFQYVFPSIVQTLGYGRIETLLLTAPVWALTFLVSLGITYSAGRTKDRSIHIICLMTLSAVGNAVATGAKNTGARYFAMFLMPLGAVSSFIIIVAWISNSFIRPLVKRSSCIAICNMLGNCASIYGTYMYPKSDAPQYVPGGSANAIVCLFVAGLAVVIRFVHLHENKKLDRGETEEIEVKVEGEQRGRGFRYVY